MERHRLAEAIGALSFATDLAAGQPQGTALGATVLAVRMGQRLGLGNDALAAVYYASIARRIGCTSTASEVSRFALGDERALNRALNLSELTDADSVRRHLDRELPSGNPSLRDEAIDQIAGLGPVLNQVADAHCVQAVTLAARLPLPAGVPALLGQVDARWDGGNALRAQGKAIPQGTRLLEFAAIVELHRRAIGPASAVEAAQSRAGGQFDPELSRLYADDHARLTRGLEGSGEWDAYLASEPGAPIGVGPAELRRLAFAFADFADQKCPFFLGHSRRVAKLAFAAAVAQGLDEASCQAIFDAGLVHDVGRCAVANGIWEKPGGLNAVERIEAESHSFQTMKVLSVGSVFSGIAELASSAHERCDGSGYHRRVRLTDPASCLLAAANLYDELTHDAPGRAALDPGSAARMVMDEVGAGRLEGKAARAVLAAGGHRPAAAELPDSGLTPREIQVLLLIARGESNKTAALKLGIAPRTVDKHTENIFRKVGVRNRTAAALFAMENGLFDT